MKNSEIANKWSGLLLIGSGIILIALNKINPFFGLFCINLGIIIVIKCNSDRKYAFQKEQLCKLNGEVQELKAHEKCLSDLCAELRNELNVNQNISIGISRWILAKYPDYAAGIFRSIIEEADVYCSEEERKFLRQIVAYKDATPVNWSKRIPGLSP